MYAGARLREPRTGKRMIGAFVDPKLWKKLHLLRIEEEKTMQAVILEAIELWLAKRKERS